MSKGITYFAETSTGLVSRYSAGHAKPQYTHAVVGGGTNSFCGSAELARKEYDSRRRWYRDAPGLVATIYPVTAYPGRHKAPPVWRVEVAETGELVGNFPTERAAVAHIGEIAQRSEADRVQVEAGHYGVTAPRGSRDR